MPRDSPPTGTWALRATHPCLLPQNAEFLLILVLAHSGNLWKGGRWYNGPTPWAPPHGEGQQAKSASAKDRSAADAAGAAAKGAGAAPKQDRLLLDAPWCVAGPCRSLPAGCTEQ